MAEQPMIPAAAVGAAAALLLLSDEVVFYNTTTTEGAEEASREVMPAEPSKPQPRTCWRGELEWTA